ncbi:MAG: hypothetical protein ACE5K0_01810 [Candidatus Methanofastidiosia archaeon]
MKRSGRIVVVSHCILNVHSLEDNLSEYQGVEEDVLKLLISKGVGIFQIPCPEMDLHGIFRKALPKDAYENPRIRAHYKKMAENILRHLVWFKKRGMILLQFWGLREVQHAEFQRLEDGRMKGEKESFQEILSL